jgi:hypothetical protein
MLRILVLLIWVISAHANMDDAYRQGEHEAQYGIKLDDSKLNGSTFLAPSDVSHLTNMNDTELSANGMKV